MQIAGMADEFLFNAIPTPRFVPFGAGLHGLIAWWRRRSPAHHGVMATLSTPSR